jgi:hypothetical protein
LSVGALIDVLTCLGVRLRLVLVLLASSAAAVASFPDSWELCDVMGETYIAGGDEELAIQSFKRSVELNPDNTHAMEMLKDLEEGYTDWPAA